MEERGITAVVATVLFVLITIVGVGIIWFVIIPIFKGNLDFDASTDLSIVTLQGYTVWDNATKLMSVQVQRGNDDKNIIGIQFIFSRGGNSITQIIQDVPEINQARVYRFNLSGFDDKPDSISIAPIFAQGNTTGSVSSLITSIQQGNVSPTNLINVTTGRDSQTPFLIVYYRDADGDGFGNATNTTTATSLPAGYLADLGSGADCNDNDANKWRIMALYVDADNDTFGDVNSAGANYCIGEFPDYFSINKLDCDDSKKEVNPNASEDKTNNIDEDCDGYINLSQCMVLNVANGVYVLDNSVKTTITCFTIKANNITINMNGFNISANGDQEDYGIDNTEGYNYTIVKNGFIHEFGTGIRSINGYNGNFTNLTITYSKDYSLGGVGVFLWAGENNYITDNNISMINAAAWSQAYGIYLYSSSNNSIINNTLKTKASCTNTLKCAGLYLLSSHNNIIQDSTANSNSEHGIWLDSSSGNKLDNNFACYNAVVDFYCYSSESNTGNRNTFDTKSGCAWAEANKTNC